NECHPYVICSALPALDLLALLMSKDYCVERLPELPLEVKDKAGQKSQVLSTESSNSPERQVKEGGVENRDSPQIMKRKKPIEKKPVEDK
ncbi:hypothetical protein U0070_000877, partial [Myodes glareolus]